MFQLNKKAIIIGAGIGGLCTAIELQRTGWKVSIWDKANSLTGLGAGIVLAPNAMFVLEKLGVANDIRNHGSKVDKAVILSWDGKEIMCLPTDIQAQKYGTHSYLIHRGALQTILRNKLKKETSLHIQKELLQFSESEHKVTAFSKDGSTEEADVLIGADGLHSKVREILFGPQPLRYSGYTALRGICTLKDNVLMDEHGGGFEAWGKGKRFGFTKIGKGKYFWFTAINTPENKEIPKLERKTKALHLLNGWCDPINAIIQATHSDDILHHDIFDRTPLTYWSSNRVTLLGDAAHPMLPNLGQGGAQAMEDAFVLTQSLNSTTDITKALKEYEEKRIPRTTKVVKQSRRMGRLVQIENPLILQARNTMLRRLPTKLFIDRMHWVVGYKIK